MPQNYSPAQYSRAYGYGSCNAGCAAQSTSTLPFNPGCKSTQCPPNPCRFGGVNNGNEGFALPEQYDDTKRENFSVNGMEQDCAYSNPFDYQNHLATNQGGRSWLGNSGGGNGYCTVNDYTVNPVQPSFATYGVSGMAGGIGTLLPYSSNRLRNSDGLTAQGMNLTDFNRQYARSGYNNGKFLQTYRGCA